MLDGLQCTLGQCIFGHLHQLWPGIGQARNKLTTAQNPWKRYPTALGPEPAGSRGLAHRRDPPGRRMGCLFAVYCPLFDRIWRSLAQNGPMGTHLGRSASQTEKWRYVRLGGPNRNYGGPFSTSKPLPLVESPSEWPKRKPRPRLRPPVSAWHRNGSTTVFQKPPRTV